MRRHQITMSDLAARSGVNRETIGSWKSRNSPSVVNLAACLGVFGYELRAVPTNRPLKETVSDD
jgi:transcriptional regulator with XRE-family HTH domain